MHVIIIPFLLPLLLAIGIIVGLLWFFRRKHKPNIRLRNPDPDQWRVILVSYSIVLIITLWSSMGMINS